MPGKVSDIYAIPGRYGYSYSITASYPELGKVRTIKVPDRSLAVSMANLQIREWHDQWNEKIRRQRELDDRQQARLALSQEKERRQAYQDSMKADAQSRTEEAAALHNWLRSLLADTLSVNDAIDWGKLKDHSDFGEEKPVAPLQPPQPPTPPIKRIQPRPTENEFQPTFDFLDKFLSSKRAAKRQAATDRFSDAVQDWERLKSEVEANNVKVSANYQLQVARWRQQCSDNENAYAALVSVWEGRRANFLREQAEQHDAIDIQRALYASGEPEAILGYCQLVLTQSYYPDFFPRQWDMDYNSETRILVVDFALPPPETIPTLTETKFVPSKDEMTEKHLTEAQTTKLYDELVYQVILRTIHELFEADTVGGIDAISLNGIVHTIDRSTGNEVSNCIASVQVTKHDFLKINLANVDPKACFKQLRGVGSSKMHSLAPVAPIARIRRDDGRFIAEKDVAHQLNEGYNLAAMDWQDFEHLIREVFGQEFSSAGGEVKVTQASRDGGVDAVAFDPDPIRGGKIVIQAKRYTGTVDVSAVRDLYGTVMNEGATKGILITTSDFGPDAYAFANGKPLSLLNGANLLYLLEKHGHRARIDLKEARLQAMRQ